VAKQITDLTVAGTERRALWTSKKGTVYVLVVMDLKKFKGAISQMGSLSEGVRKAVEERAEKAFQELDKETEKEKSGQ
jgi:hypothetical protein